MQKNDMQICVCHFFCVLLRRILNFNPIKNETQRQKDE